jgi:chaperonin cofactor prefoldin
MDGRLGTLGERLDRMDRRLEDLEKQILGVHTRVDDLSGDMRQRFRVLNDQVGGIERRLVA